MTRPEQTIIICSAGLKHVYLSHALGSKVKNYTTDFTGRPPASRPCYTRPVYDTALEVDAMSSNPEKPVRANFPVMPDRGLGHLRPTVPLKLMWEIRRTF